MFFLYNIAIDNTLFETIRMEQNFQIPLDQLADHLIEPLERCVDQMESFEARLVLLEEEAQAKLKIIQKTATKEVRYSPHTFTGLGKEACAHSLNCHLPC